MVYKIEEFNRYFVPNRNTHQDALEKMRIQTTEMAYVSCDLRFIKNAMGFLSATILISDGIRHDEIGSSPDLVCQSVSILSTYLQMGLCGYLGEVAVYPDGKSKRGVIVHLYIVKAKLGFLHWVDIFHIVII